MSSNYPHQPALFSYEDFRRRSSLSQAEGSLSLQSNSDNLIRSRHREQLLEVEHLSAQLQQLTSRKEQSNLLFPPRPPPMVQSMVLLGKEETEEDGENNKNVTATTINIEVMEAIEESTLAEEEALESAQNSPVKSVTSARASRKSEIGIKPNDKALVGSPNSERKNIQPSNKAEKIKQDINELSKMQKQLESKKIVKDKGMKSVQPVLNNTKQAKTSVKQPIPTLKDPKAPVGSNASKGLVRPRTSTQIAPRQPRFNSPKVENEEEKQIMRVKSIEKGGRVATRRERQQLIDKMQELQEYLLHNDVAASACPVALSQINELTSLLRGRH